MRSSVQFLAFFALAASAAFGAAPVPLHVASNELAIARRALGDGNWYTAERRSGIALGSPELGNEARLVQLEALARSGRASEIPSRLESWGNPAGEPFRYWRAFALVESGKYDEARAILKEKFDESELALLAERLAAQLEHEAGDYKAASAHFAAAADLIPSNGTARVENALAWALNFVSAGDGKGAREVLAKEGALEAGGSAGDAARLLAADVAAKSGDAKGARSLRERIVADGGKAAEDAFVRASLALAEEDWLAGSTNSAITFASNAVARASRPGLKALAGFDLGFRELAMPGLRTNGIARINALVREFPDVPGAEEALVRLADALLVGGDAEEALKAYDRFQQAYPAQTRMVHVFEGRGLALMELGRVTEAFGVFARAVQVATNEEARARCQFHQGDALMAAGRFSEAADAYGAVKGTNLVSFARFQQADALSRAGKSELAAKRFREVMHGGSEYAVEAGLRLASGYASAGRMEDAAGVYGELLGKPAKGMPELTSGQRARALEGRGRVNYRAYRFEEAERDFAEVAKIDASRTGQMRFFCSLCLYGAGKDDKAYSSAKELLAETPDSPLRADLMLWLAKFDFAKRDYPSAFAAFEACATNQHMAAGRRLDALVRAARCAAEQSDYNKLIEIVTRVLSHPAAVAATTQKTAETPIVAEALLLQGEALMDQARFDEAVLVLERAAGLSIPDEMRRRVSILKADCLFARGADNSAYYQRAVDEYRAVQQDADTPPSTRLAVSFKLARALEKLHNLNDAIDQYFANVILAYVDGVKGGVLFDGNARAFFARAAFNLADAYEASGETWKAERVLRYVVEAQVPSADEASKRISRLKKEGGFK